MSAKHRTLINRIQICREYAELWQAYFQLFSDDLTEKQITEQMEREFENIVGVLALNNYKFSELCGEFMKDCPEVLRILCQTPNLNSLKEMNEGTFQKLQVGWHTAFIDMNKALGRMLAKLTPKQLEALQQQQGAGAEQPQA